MSRWDTVAIVGVGLIGGSIGLGLRRRKFANRVVGIGRRESTLKEALRRGAINEFTTDIRQGVREAALVIVCTPVGDIVRHVQAAAGACPPAALITDTGSTKREIVETLAVSLPASANFVGSHPLAGSEKRGPGAAREDLFEGCVVVVTPHPSSSPETLQGIERFWSELGASTLRLTPEAHDTALAATSHLPHAVATALAAATPQEDLGLVASGWLDSTRIASGDPEMWKQILLENATPVLRSLDAFVAIVSRYREAIEQRDQGLLLDLLQAGKDRRDAVGNRHSSGKKPS